MSPISLSPIRRSFLATAAAAGAVGLPPAQLLAATEDNTIHPFRIKVPEEALVDLRQRLSATR